MEDFWEQSQQEPVGFPLRSFADSKKKRPLPAHGDVAARRKGTSKALEEIVE